MSARISAQSGAVNKISEAVYLLSGIETMLNMMLSRSELVVVAMVVAVSGENGTARAEDGPLSSSPI